MLDATGDILKEICGNEYTSASAKQAHLSTLKDQIPLLATLEYLFVHRPEDFCAIFAYMENQAEALRWIRLSKGNKFYEALLKAADKETVNLLVSSLDRREQDEFYTFCRDNLTIQEMAETIIQLNESHVTIWLQHFLQDAHNLGILLKASRAILNACYEENNSFASRAMANMHFSDFRLSDWLLDNLERLADEQIAQLIHSLNPYQQKQFFHSLQPIQIAEISFFLVSSEQTCENAIALLSRILQSLDDYKFYDYCEELLDNLDDEESLCNLVPYFVAAIGQEHLEKFSQMEVKTRALLLNNMIVNSPSKYNEIKAFFDPRVVDYLLNDMPLNIISQNPIQSNQEVRGEYATFDEICSYLEEAAAQNSLGEYMTTFKSDFKHIPPLLISLAMQVESRQSVLVQTAEYMKHSQLTGFALGLEQKSYTQILDSLLDKGVLLKNLQRIFENLPQQMKDDYLFHRFPQIEERLVKMQGFLQKFQEYFALLDAGENTYQEAVKASQECMHHLVIILSSQHQILLQYSQQSNHPMSPRISLVFSSCKNLLQDFTDPVHGYLKKLADMRPKQPPDTLSFIWKEKLIQSGFKEKDLVQVGLVSDKDFACLGITWEKDDYLDLINKYLHQNGNLVNIWNLFRRKHFSSLSDLTQMEMIEHQEELFNLQQLAGKMGDGNDKQ